LRRFPSQPNFSLKWSVTRRSGFLAAQTKKPTRWSACFRHPCAGKFWWIGGLEQLVKTSMDERSAVFENQKYRH
ncbi:MAG TPA: hypothetical protein VJ577_14845, partial [Burkholderiaceae bacterium]|nr:hypothetical protein [Burkholderiaceae bacterium]